jgi:hypothetical protein
MYRNIQNQSTTGKTESISKQLSYNAVLIYLDTRFVIVIAKFSNFKCSRFLDYEISSLSITKSSNV